MVCSGSQKVNDNHIDILISLLVILIEWVKTNKNIYDNLTIFIFDLKKYNVNPLVLTAAKSSQTILMDSSR